MGFIRPVKNMPPGLSWQHLLRSAENNAAFSRENLQSVKLFGGEDVLDNTEGVVKLSSQKLSLDGVIRKIPEKATLIYSGQMISRNHAYENQFSMLSFMAYPWLLSSFREFSDDLISKVENLNIDEYLETSSESYLLYDKSGRFKDTELAAGFFKERVKNWIW